MKREAPITRFLVAPFKAGGENLTNPPVVKVEAVKQNVGKKLAFPPLAEKEKLKALATTTVKRVTRPVNSKNTSSGKTAKCKQNEVKKLGSLNIPVKQKKKVIPAAAVPNLTKKEKKRAAAAAAGSQKKDSNNSAKKPAQNVAVSVKKEYKLPDAPIVAVEGIRVLQSGNSCCIRLILERNEVSVEVLKQSKCTYVRSPMRTNTVSACISFAGEKPCVGQTALQDKADHPEYVVSDILSILKTNKTSPDRDQQIVLVNGEFFVRCKTQFGQRLIPRHVILAAFLTAVVRMTQRSMETIIENVFFLMPMEFQNKEVKEIKRSCALIPLKCAGFTQYSPKYLR